MARMSLATSVFMPARDTYLGGQAVQIRGKRFVTGWWRVICTDDTVGNCFVTTDPAYITVVDVMHP